MDFSTLDNLYGDDDNRNESGVEVHIGLNSKNDPIIINVAEAGNNRHQKAIRKYERALESCRHKPKKRHLITAKIVADSLLVGWSGIIDKKGKPVDPTFENKVAAMVHSKQFFAEVLDAAQDRANFTAENNDLQEESEKN